MTINVLPQLQAIASDLATQEEILTARLQELREQLRGVRSVLPMFENAATPTATPETPESPDLDINAPEEAISPAVIPPAAAVKKPDSTKTKQKKAVSKKKDGRAALWQKYTRPGVNESIPDAVRLILETQPEKDFKIVEVMDALFKEDMPKSQYLKARNRVSNVLSGGVRAGDWHRGERSTYRMSAA